MRNYKHNLRVTHTHTREVKNDKNISVEGVSKTIVILECVQTYVTIDLK